MRWGVSLNSELRLTWFHLLYLSRFSFRRTEPKSWRNWRRWKRRPLALLRDWWMPWSLWWVSWILNGWNSYRMFGAMVRKRRIKRSSSCLFDVCIPFWFSRFRSSPYVSSDFSSTFSSYLLLFKPNIISKTREKQLWTQSRATHPSLHLYLKHVEA